MTHLYPIHQDQCDFVIINIPFTDLAQCSIDEQLYDNIPLKSADIRGLGQIQ